LVGLSKIEQITQAGMSETKSTKTRYGRAKMYD
jgi:hypothetical protein